MPSTSRGTEPGGATALRWVLTAQGSSDRLTEQVPLLAATGDTGVGVDAAGLPSVFVDTQRRLQQIEGFGGAFTESAAVTWQGLDAAQRDALLRAYFDPAQGHGYTLCRVHMNSCDFALGNYAHADVPGDVALQHFNIDRDRRALLPFIQAALALAGRPVKLLVSPWSPPAWMKDSGQMNGGGQLLPSCAAAWAQCFVRFIRAY